MVFCLVECTLLLLDLPAVYRFESNIISLCEIRYPDKNIATRKVVCDWIKDNRPVWERWIPDTLLNTGCRKKSADGLCSGHGSCEAPAGTKGNNIIGSCKCKMGFAGEMCERDGKRNAEKVLPD